MGTKCAPLVENVFLILIRERFHEVSLTVKIRLTLLKLSIPLPGNLITYQILIMFSLNKWLTGYTLLIIN